MAATARIYVLGIITITICKVHRCRGTVSLCKTSLIHTTASNLLQESSQRDAMTKAFRAAESQLIDALEVTSHKCHSVYTDIHTHSLFRALSLFLAPHSLTHSLFLSISVSLSHFSLVDTRHISWTHCLVPQVSGTSHPSRGHLTAQRRKGEIQALYGDLVLSDGLYAGNRGRRWRIDWDRFVHSLFKSLSSIFHVHRWVRSIARVSCILFGFINPFNSLTIYMYLYNHAYGADQPARHSRSRSA